jgi:RNA polymerase sigma factor (sigma-70 family)
VQLSPDELEQLAVIARRSCRCQARPFRGDADDALGEVFLDVVTNCEAQAAVRRLERFAARTARLQARRVFRREARRQVRSLPDGLSDAGRRDPLTLLTSAEEHEALQRALSALPPRKRAVLHAWSEARGHDGWAPALAAAWGLSRQRVYQLFVEAKEDIRRRLKVR